MGSIFQAQTCLQQKAGLERQQSQSTVPLGWQKTECGLP